MTYTDIGSTFHQSHELQCQHTEFAEACEVRVLKFQTFLFIIEIHPVMMVSRQSVPSL